LAHWAIKESRTSPGYERVVTRLGVGAAVPDGATAQASRMGVDPLSSDAAAAADETIERLVGVVERATAPRRLTEVSSPREALQWAKGLEARNPQHRLEAKAGLGHWGDEVDAVLNAKFPGLVQKAVDTAKKDRDKKSATVAKATAVEPVVVEAAEDPVTVQQLAERIGELDPAKPIHRREAHLLLGHVPLEIDRLIAEKFGDDSKIVEKVTVLYPDGLPEADAAAWRNRAQGDEAVAAAEASVPDDPATPRREDVDGDVASQGERGRAAAERGIATTVAGRPEAHRRTVQQQQGPVRRRT
jgi:hypothetical protein